MDLPLDLLSLECSLQLITRHLFSIIVNIFTQSHASLFQFQLSFGYLESVCFIIVESLLYTVLSFSETFGKK